METRVLPRDGWVLVALRGRLDMTSAGTLEEKLESAIAGGQRRLAIDLDGLEYLSSAGLRALLVTARRLQQVDGTLALIGLRGPVKDVLELAGLANVFPAFATEAELLAALPDWR
jgi:anti-anti-sigma factor